METALAIAVRCALLFFGLAALAGVAVAGATHFSRTLRRLPRRAAVALVAAFCVCFYLGATKGNVHIRWDASLYNDGSVVTNDTVSIRWTYSGIPDESDIYIDCRLFGTTNEWSDLGHAVASDRAWTGTLANATNYEYFVYSEYIPPAPVHTNGVWVAQGWETKARAGASSFVVVGAKVEDKTGERQ